MGRSVCNEHCRYTRLSTRVRENHRWLGVRRHDSDRNVTLNVLSRRLGLAANRRLAAAKGYDLGRLVAEGWARAPERTRSGIRKGLEQVKCAPAAEGYEGTLLGF